MSDVLIHLSHTDLTPEQLDALQAHCAWRKANPEVAAREVAPPEVSTKVLEHLKPLGTRLDIMVPTEWILDSGAGTFSSVIFFFNL